MNFYRIVALLNILMLTGCANVSAIFTDTVIDYETTVKMGTKDAVATLEELTMTQHPNWRPERFEIKDDYAYWSYGSVIENDMYGRAEKIVGSSERIYYRTINKVRLMKWQRKFKDWYVVSLINSDGGVIKHVFYSRDINLAKRYVDAANSALVAYKKIDKL